MLPAASSESTRGLLRFAPGIALSAALAAVALALVDVDTFILAMAMAALGLTTHVSAVRKAGIKPLLLGGVLFVWLILGGGLINDLVARALN